MKSATIRVKEGFSSSPGGDHENVRTRRTALAALAVVLASFVPACKNGTETPRAAAAGRRRSDDGRSRKSFSGVSPTARPSTSTR
ncbi:MAG: hypothetical protein MZV63_65580 [Marinilabiliales bacterium]|nr:hypothetical protein [Marinilabiliales bacterium]